MKGIVTKSTGSWYTVRAEGGESYDCRLKGKFRTKGIKSTNPVAVGDKVEFKQEDEANVIFKLEPRENYIIRKSINLSKQTHIIAANVDQAFLFVTLKLPETSLEFIDRFLVSAEAYHIPTKLIFNKIDIYDEEEIKRIRFIQSIYTKIGYECFEVSAEKQINLAVIEELLKDKITMLSGHSGVGKSTLINQLDPELDLRTLAISEANKSGMHTTTFAEMHPLVFGGDIIDTPGIKGFGVVHLENAELRNYFPEMSANQSDCKFSNCIHINEPGCAVKDAIDAGEISTTRYASYLSITEDEQGETYRAKGY
ncbi:ribosome small subunit-dependent GTPase A [Vicingaceae bacterium]|nr:ribosome small subunit-dependent GTPase A [Vicingaceae bacterium]